MKGFGFNPEKQALVAAIQGRNLKQAEKALAQIEKRLSSEEALGVVMQILSALPQADVDWATENLISDQMYDTLDEQVSMMFYDMLTAKSFRAGREFSFGENGFILSQAAYDAILPEVPEAYRDVFSTEMVTIQAESPIDQLEQQLGVPFIDNLIERIEQRMPSLSDREASMYLYNIGNGVENRTGIPMMEILIGHFGENERFGKVFDLIQKGKSAENSDWIYDLVASAGGEAELQPDPDDPANHQLSRRAMELLDTVYLGSRPFAPIIEALDQLDNP
jgi:hypothetical protein